MQSVVKETRRLKNILNFILDYSRVDSLHREFFDLAQSHVMKCWLLAGEFPSEKWKSSKSSRRLKKRPVRFLATPTARKQCFSIWS